MISSKSRKVNLRFWLMILVSSGCILLAVFIVRHQRQNIQKTEAINSTQTTKSFGSPFSSPDVVGNLGGMKVKIPRACIELVEYNNDPNWGETRLGRRPERTEDSILRSFGLSLRYPEMLCKSEPSLIQDYQAKRSSYENPWVEVSINAGEIYPKLGIKAADGNARAITDSIKNPTPFWFRNFEKLPNQLYGLDVYVVAGMDPKTGIHAKDLSSTPTVYIHQSDNGYADVYIECTKPAVVGGRGSCQMGFGMEPIAKVHLNVTFVEAHLKAWSEIKTKVIDTIKTYNIQTSAQASA